MLPGLPRTGGEASALPPGSRELEVLSDDFLQLGFGETEELRVLLTDDEGEPIAGGAVTFALVGRPQDCSLATVSATTDENGIAVNELVAGTMAAAFSVRITAPGAYEASVSVRVSNSGFGTLEVQADYTGARAVAQRVIFAQAAMDCEHAARNPGDPMVTLGPGEQTASFVALPASAGYAILALGESENGEEVARGCTDGVRVVRDGRVAVSVELQDAPLELSGSYALQVDLDTGVPASTLGTALRAGAEAAVKADARDNAALMHAEARFLLDALDSTLRSEDYADEPGSEALADAIAQERMMPAGDPPEQSLQALLSIKQEGALAVVPRLVQLTSSDLRAVRLFVELAAERQGDASLLTWQPLRAEALSVAKQRTAVTLDLSALEAVPVNAEPIAGRDALQLDSVRFALPFGALGAQVLRQVVALDDEGHGEEIRTLVGCTALSQWLSEQSYEPADACDESCVRSTCDRAVALLTSAAENSLIALDEARPTVVLSGEIELGDEDGDLHAEQLSAEMLLGEWEPASEGESGDAVSGAATANALAASAEQ